MKHLYTLLLSLMVFIAPLNVMAQSKVAHINTQQLISEMPEVIAAQNELKKFAVLQYHLFLLVCYDVYPIPLSEKASERS